MFFALHANSSDHTATMMMMYILYHVFLFFMPSLATLLFSILVVLLPIEKSIMILISPLLSSVKC